MKPIRIPTLGLVGGVTALALSAALATSAFAGLTGAPTRPSQRVPIADVSTLAQPGAHAWKVLATAATYIGITEAQLRTELEAGKSLAEVAVAKGKTRDGLIAALSTAATQAIGTLVDQKGLAGPGGPGKGGLHLKGEPFAVASTYLGIPQADLMTRVRAGETLAAIANATAGKSRAGLVAAIVADNTAKIDAAATAGKITADQATRLKAELTEHATRAVDHARPAGPKGGRGRP